MRLDLTEDELGEATYALSQRRELCASRVRELNGLAVEAAGVSAPLAVAKYRDMSAYWQRCHDVADSAYRKIMEVIP